MRYLVRGRQIRTENAAKPYNQASSRTIHEITELGTHRRVLDYGCGKLRYVKTLAPLSTSLTLVDSAIQLDRFQRLFGRRSSIRVYAPVRWPNVRVLDVDQFASDRRQYDFILCANVISAIPCARTRWRVLLVLAQRLARGGTCLFVSQHRNTEFAKAAGRPTTMPHLGGFILNGARRCSFYTPIGRDTLVPLLSRTGHRIIRACVFGESTFVQTTRTGFGWPQSSMDG